MSLIKKEKMQIGSKVKLTEDYKRMNGDIFTKGHEFTIIGYDDIRGYDLKDEEGNCIYETRFGPNYILSSEYKEDTED